MAIRERPLSPHLQVYRWMYTMATSMAHRATGVALTAGLALLVFWLWSLASGPEAYGRARGLLASPLGLLVIGGFVVSFWYHFCNGLRHLAWDAGYGLEKASARRSARIVAIATLVLAAVTILALWRVGGRP